MATQSEFGAVDFARLHPHELVTYGDAERAVIRMGRAMADRYELIFRRIGTAAAWRAWKQSRKTIAMHVAKALVEVRVVLYAQNKKPNGPRRISTRNWKRGVTLDARCGHRATHRRQGRPSLSESEWIRRERARRKKRRKTDRRRKKYAPKVLRAPKTKYPRPRSTARPMRDPRTPPAPPAPAPEVLSEEVRKILNDLGEFLGEAIRDGVKDVWDKEVIDPLKKRANEIGTEWGRMIREWYLEALARNAGEGSQ